MTNEQNQNTVIHAFDHAGSSFQIKGATFDGFITYALFVDNRRATQDSRMDEQLSEAIARSNCGNGKAGIQWMAEEIERAVRNGSLRVTA